MQAHALCFEVGANLFDGCESGVIIGRVMSCGEELVLNVGMDIVFKETDSCLVVGFSTIHEFHELCNEGDYGHVVGLPKLL